MTKQYNQQTFRATVDGRVYLFYAYTTSTRMGFCHTVVSPDLASNTKVSYCNRTWESFRYETVLKQAIKKMPKSIQPQLTAILIDKTAQEKRESADKMVSAFQTLYKGTSPEMKEQLKDVTLHDESDARAVMGLMALDNIMNQTSTAHD